MGCKNITEQTKHSPSSPRVRYPFGGGNNTYRINKQHPIGLVLGGGSPTITNIKAKSPEREKFITTIGVVN
jgi:hypothetical protein